MNKKSFGLKVIIFALTGFFPFLCAAQEVISPSDGVWANRQILVIDVPSGSSAYYSLSCCLLTSVPGK